MLVTVEEKRREENKKLIRAVEGEKSSVYLTVADEAIACLEERIFEYDFHHDSTR